MLRIDGAPSVNGGKIAVITNDALGNYVAATPLLQMLRTHAPGAEIHYYCGSRVDEFGRATPEVDQFRWAFGKRPRDVIVPEPPLFDWVINCESSAWAKCLAALLAGSNTIVSGPCLDHEGRGDLPFLDNAAGRLSQDPAWIDDSLLERHPKLKSSFIGEIFCRCAGLDGEVPFPKVPRSPAGQPIPDVLISASASLDEKLWDPMKWIQAVNWMDEQGWSVGLLGAKPGPASRYWTGSQIEQQLVDDWGVQDLRGAFTLPQVADAIAQARGVLTIDNGILHIAASVGTPTVGLYRRGIHRLWAPPSPQLTALIPAEELAVDAIELDQVLHHLGELIRQK